MTAAQLGVAAVYLVALYLIVRAIIRNHREIKAARARIAVLRSRLGLLLAACLASGCAAKNPEIITIQSPRTMAPCPPSTTFLYVDYPARTRVCARQEAP